MQKKRMDGDLIMESDGVLASIDFVKFFSCIGGSIEDIIEQNEFSHEVIYLFLKKIASCFF